MVLGPAEPHGFAAADASDASSLLSALCAAAAAARCALPMIVRVGPADALRLIGRRAGPLPRRYCCDYTSYPPAAHAHLPGMLALFHNKRVAARRVLPPSRADAVVSARYTYYWSDFSFKVAAAPDSFAQDPLLAAIHRPVLASADPVQYMVLTLLWPSFSASEVLDNPATASDSAVASLSAPTSSMSPRNAATFRLSPPRDVFVATTAPRKSFLPLTNPVHTCLRLTHKSSLMSSRPQRPAAARALIDIHRAVTRSSGSGGTLEDIPRLSEAHSAPVLYGRAAGTTPDAATRRERWKRRDENNGPWASSGPPEGAMDDFVAQVAEYVAAAAVENDKLDEEFLVGAVISLFGLGTETGLVSEVVEALGPGVAEMTAVDRISRLAASSNSVTIAQRLWGLFLDGIELHWEMGWPVRGVPYDAQVGPATDACLLVQKLEMLNCCLHRLHNTSDSAEKESSPSASSGTPLGRKRRVQIRTGKGVEPDGESMEVDGGVEEEDDSEGVWEPIVQLMPFVTRDMTEAEQTRIVMNADKAAGGVSNRPPEAARQSSALRSDMMSFKAANPGASMSDFVKWFSPVDWIEGDSEAHSDVKNAEGGNAVEGESKAKSTKTDQLTSAASSRPSQSGRLSARMQTPGNLWQEIWDSVEAVPASKQVPLFDAHMHGLKALADLRTYPMKEVMRQFACIQAMYSIRVLQRAYQRPPLLPSVCASIMAARQSGVECQLITPDGDAEALAMIADTCDKLATAEHMALGAASLVTKVPPGAQFAGVIDALVSGEDVDVTAERERHALSLVAGMEEGGWRTPLISSYREFILDGSDSDRMSVKLSSEMFRVGMTWGIQYSGGFSL